MNILSDATLGELPDTIKRPGYDRATLSPGIVHIGLGNFHRAHQSWYLHRLFERDLDKDWAIVGAGVRPFDAIQREKLAAQDYLTMLIELDPAGTSAEIVGSMIDYVPVDSGNVSLIKKMADPAIRIVTLTVTEGGYFLEPATREFDASHPDIQHDIEGPESPVTVFGAIVAALKLRRDQDIGPFTIQSCDNLRGNGNITRQAIVSLARLSAPDLADWIDQHCSFPNSMVDCIVPATGPKEIALAKQFGVIDELVVTHESFRQWVIEDTFCAGRPHWEKVGVTFTDDVFGYEEQKIRMLNGGHQIIVNLAELLHIETIADAMRHAGIRAFFHKVQLEEIVPHVVPVPGMTPEAYVDLVAKRFSNPAIVDTTRRVAYDGSSRHPGMVLPSIHDGVSKGVSVQGLALAEAAWARMCAGTRQDNSEIEPNDPNWDVLRKTANRARSQPQAWLEMRQTYGELANQPDFSHAFAKWLSLIWNSGVEAAIEAYCDSGQVAGSWRDLK